jgi:hypothetical protein
MPPFPPIANVLQVRVFGHTNQPNTSEEWNNIFHVKWGGATPTSASLNDIAGVLYGTWVDDAGLISLQTVDTTIEGMELVDLTSDTGAVSVYTTSTTGTNGEDPLPSQVCTLFNAHVDLRYRGGHPRYYLNAGGDGNLADMQTWNSGYLTEAQNAMDQWISACQTTTEDGTSLDGLGFVSYYNKAEWESIPDNPLPPYRRDTPVWYPFTGDQITVNSILATQRRRIKR